MGPQNFNSNPLCDLSFTVHREKSNVERAKCIHAPQPSIPEGALEPKLLWHTQARNLPLEKKMIFQRKQH